VASALCVLALAAAPGAAVAASPTAGGYSETGGSTLPPAAAAPQYATKGTESAPTKASSLPFTGADIGLGALGGVILLSLGLVLRRTTRVTP
jgi:hypothetical protein